MEEVSKPFIYHLELEKYAVVDSSHTFLYIIYNENEETYITYNVIYDIDNASNELFSLTPIHELSLSASEIIYYKEFDRCVAVDKTTSMLLEEVINTNSRIR